MIFRKGYRMTELKLSQDIAQFFVNNTMKGYANYTRRRKQDAENMIVSRAGAWLKGNFIDTAIAKASATANISYQKRFAGYSWEYLQFNFYDKSTDSVNSIILKNYKTLKSSIKGRKNKLPDYLAQDSIGNVDILDENRDIIHSTGEAVQLELFPHTTLINSKNVEFKNKADNHRFYVVGYTLDSEKNISSLKLIMPNPKNNALVEVADWTKYIEEVPIQPDIDDLLVLQSDKNIPEEQYDDNSNMKYQIADDSQEQDK